MNKVKKGLTTLWRNEEGLTTVEYAIAGALVGLAVVTMFTNLGTAVAGVISNLVSAVTAEISGAFRQPPGDPRAGPRQVHEERPAARSRCAAAFVATCAENLAATGSRAPEIRRVACAAARERGRHAMPIPDFAAQGLPMPGIPRARLPPACERRA